MPALIRWGWAWWAMMEGILAIAFLASSRPMAGILYVSLFAFSCFMFRVVSY